jgi:type IV pilus assembly protein PilW
VSHRPFTFAQQKGFSLVELMVSLAIGTVMSIAVIQVMISNRVTSEFNRTVAEVQESGRFILTRLKNELLEAGLYDSLYTPIAMGVDEAAEEAFVRNHPVIIGNDLPAQPTLTSANGADSGSDTLIISQQSAFDCAGSNYGAAVGEEIHIVNAYFVDGLELKCTGYNGRVLRGVTGGDASSGTVVLMDDVKSFQVQYGISGEASTGSGNAVQYVTADQLAAMQTANRMVVSIRIGVLLQSASSLSSLEDKTHTVLDVTNRSVDTKHYGQVFSHTVALRNMKNFVRSI